MKTVVAYFFLLEKFSQKDEKKVILEGFNWQKQGKIYIFICARFLYFVFQCLAINIKGLMKYLYFILLVYSQIWRNTPRYDRHFFHIFIWMIAI